MATNRSCTAEPACADPSRRRFLMWSQLALAAGLLRFPMTARASRANACTAIPLAQVKLEPSIYLDAIQANRRYLMTLSADRLLHNFRLYAGLPPKGPAYGGWESDTIAGHTLGHYLSALAKLHAQTGDAEARARVDYIVAELGRCQTAGGDGYVGGLSRKLPGGPIESGRKVFEAIHAGRIDAAKFHLNGSWSPLYTVHKMLAGLLDAQRYVDNAQAMEVAQGMGRYLDRCLAPLDDRQMQQLMVCEFGGINESFAELHARTSDARWLALARRFHRTVVVDPLAQCHDALPHLHANTTIPMVVGLAREFELDGDASMAAAARFFWETAVAHYTYAIGGNGDREYFQQPDTIAGYLTEQTCEHCASYNMLKLTRHLYQWTPDARYFDYYERTLHNHVMAQQHPRTGMFTYMTPMISGAAREYSSPCDDFWCCVGTGMESHAQFGDSIYWHDGQALYVNLFIPSTLDWTERELKLRLHGGMPLDGQMRIEVLAVGPRSPRVIALRIPQWAGDGWSLRVNGRSETPSLAHGYARLERAWHAGDTVELELPMQLRLEAAEGDASTVAVLRGPLVMAADLGDAAKPFDQPDPALVADGDPLAAFAPAGGAAYVAASTRPAGLRFVPFYSQYDRLSAVYFRRTDQAGWQRELRHRAEEKAARARLAQASVDMIQFGDDASEQAHRLRSDTSFGGAYRRQPCRDARGGGFIEFDLRNAPGVALALRLRYWGSDAGRFRIVVNGVPAVDVTQAPVQVADFVDHDYPLPVSAAASLHVRIEPTQGDTAGPLFGGWLVRRKPA